MGKDADGRSRGYAHVDFFEEGEAKKVYEKLHQQLLLDRKVHVDEASNNNSNNNNNNSNSSKNSNRGY
jgi:RNA recognition motif-containing protein